MTTRCSFRKKNGRFLRIFQCFLACWKDFHIQYLDVSCSRNLQNTEFLSQVVHVSISKKAHERIPELATDLSMSFSAELDHKLYRQIPRILT